MIICWMKIYSFVTKIPKIPLQKILYRTLETSTVVPGTLVTQTLRRGTAATLQLEHCGSSSDWGLILPRETSKETRDFGHWSQFYSCQTSPRQRMRHGQFFPKYHRAPAGGNAPFQPTLVVGRLEIVIGGPHLVGNSRKALERYARPLRHDPKAKVLEVAERPPKSQHYKCDPITFGDSDSYHVSYPYNDPLVVEVQIANMMVERVMIDEGASSNILFKQTLIWMGLSPKDLETCEQLMYGFSRACIAPFGKIKLSLTAGTTPRQTTIMATLIVVDVKSPYNVMLRRQVLYDLRAISSIYHLSVKFPMMAGIDCLLGNQGTAR
uniref:Uncharacterized protein n=1 Tax=Cannabis sativa TaxID=3483 RepID=A0A803PTI0_CANSA